MIPFFNRTLVEDDVGYMFEKIDYDVMLMTIEIQNRETPHNLTFLGHETCLIAFRMY